MKLFASAAIAAVLTMAAPYVASAQDLATQEMGSNFTRDRNVSVRERPRPDYEAIGIKTGGFTVYPRVTVEATYDDNIYASAVNEESDTIWRVRPQVAVRSGWSRNALGAFASASINRYSKFDEENTEEYTIGANGRLDIQRGANVGGTIQYQKLTEPRTSPTAPTAAASPVEYSLVNGTVTGTKEFNRLRLSGRFDLKAFDYDDATQVGGGILDQDTRDRDEYVYGGKAEYAVSPDTALYVSIIGNTKDYDKLTPPPASNPAQPGFQRGSDGYNAVVGANFDLSQRIRGEIEGGYMKQKYDDARYSDIDGFGAKGRLEWFPTDLSTVTFTGSRTIEESVAVGSQGFISNDVSAGVDHELMRNVLLSAKANYSKGDYKGIDRTDKRSGVNASVSYLLNRHVGLFLNYTYLKQDSSGTAQGTSFKDNKIAASVALQF